MKLTKKKKNIDWFVCFIVMPRATRTTGEQIELLINYLEGNKILIIEKTISTNQDEVNKHWEINELVK